MFKASFKTLFMRQVNALQSTHLPKRLNNNRPGNSVTWEDIFCPVP